MQEITTVMREKGINMEWVDLEEWRRKIKLKLQAQKDGQTSRFCTKIKINKAYRLVCMCEILGICMDFKGNQVKLIVMFELYTKDVEKYREIKCRKPERQR